MISQSLKMKYFNLYMVRFTEKKANQFSKVHTEALKRANYHYQRMFTMYPLEGKATTYLSS